MKMNVSCIRNTHICQNTCLTCDHRFDQYKLQKLVDAHGPKYLEMRDAIHGDMIIHPLLVGFIKRKEFARLNKIKQLGAGE